MFDCPNLAVPMSVMQHVIRVESSQNPFAIGVVGGRLARQPKNLSEAVATANMLEQKGFNFSLGVAQVNRYNLAKYGLVSYQAAFEVCPNIQAGTRILRECYDRAKDWGKAFSCYYSGNFVTGYKHGYVQKVFASMSRGAQSVPYVPVSGVINVVSSRRAESGISRRTVSAVKTSGFSAQMATPARVSRVVVRAAQSGGAMPNARYLDDPVPAGTRVSIDNNEVGVAAVVQANPPQRVPVKPSDGAFVF